MSVKMHAYLERVYDHKDAMHPNYTLLAKLRISNIWDIYDYFGFGDFMGPFSPGLAVVDDCSREVTVKYQECRENYGCSNLMEVNLEMLEQIRDQFNADKEGLCNNNQLDPIIGIIREINKTPNTTGRLVFWFEF